MIKVMQLSVVMASFFRCSYEITFREENWFKPKSLRNGQVKHSQRI